MHATVIQHRIAKALDRSRDRMDGVKIKGIRRDIPRKRRKMDPIPSSFLAVVSLNRVPAGSISAPANSGDAIKALITT
jgi:hypothetical protein